MFGLLDPRIWLAALILSAVAFGGGFWKGHNHGVSMERATWLTAQAEADKLARKVAADRQARVDVAMADAARREGRLRADARNAAAALQRLRDSIGTTVYTGQTPGDATTARTSPVGELLEACGRELVEVGRAADGHVSDLQTLIQAWPR